eukprot:TRINITY_DN19278_c0_g1_i1.p1 TRINITY_DN19278_c0_g1~~TRINITY_DN19278_c0_g1_i1.p1  ORF type:complete len:123 (+),score=24.54 TRINITY_DN19278_c0_g1_i1:118-486(+)
MIRRPPRSTLSSSSAASDVYKRQELIKHLLARGGSAAATGLLSGLQAPNATNPYSQATLSQPTQYQTQSQYQTQTQVMTASQPQLPGHLGVLQGAQPVKRAPKRKARGWKPPAQPKRSAASK